LLHISFICCETCLTFRWTEREGGRTRGKEKVAERERERLTTRRERVKLSVRGREEIKGRGGSDI
jgi:hypothetical protein